LWIETAGSAFQGRHISDSNGFPALYTPGVFMSSTTSASVKRAGSARRQNIMPQASFAGVHTGVALHNTYRTKRGMA
jgi:hypothetical protein